MDDETPRAQELDRISAYFSRMEPDLKPIALALRKHILSIDPMITERLKSGNPTYSKKGDVLWIYALSKQWINLGFFRGAELLEFDTEGRIEGTGKGMRHIKFKTVDDIDRLYLTRLIMKALALDGT